MISNARILPKTNFLREKDGGGGDDGTRTKQNAMFTSTICTSFIIYLFYLHFDIQSVQRVNI